MKGFSVILTFAVCVLQLEGYNGVQPILSEMAVLKVCPFYCWILALERNFLEVFLILWEEEKGI